LLTHETSGTARYVARVVCRHGTSIAPHLPEATCATSRSASCPSCARTAH